MNNILVSLNSTWLLEKSNNDQLQKLAPEIERLNNARSQGYQSPYSFVTCVEDDQCIQLIQALSAEKRALNPTVLVVIGIGGSNLGTMAIYQALKGSFYNEETAGLKVYYADAVDTDAIASIVRMVTQRLARGESIIVNAISKSGTTTETIANLLIFVSLLRSYYPTNYADYIVVTTDKGSCLWEYAITIGCAGLEIPAAVGGRYSVFSAVGLFPLALLGIDIHQLLLGARSVLNAATGSVSDLLMRYGPYDGTKDNVPAIRALFLLNALRQGASIHDMFLFSVDCESIGKWYRQLMAESLGKPVYGTGEPVGITPTVSIGSIDLHSMGQLYLGGPLDKVTTFIDVAQYKQEVVIAHDQNLVSCVANIQGKPLSYVNTAIFRGVETAYRERGLPYSVVTLPAKTAYTVGQLLLIAMIEIVYLGRLLEVNVFDQPHVESYKKNTRKMLAYE